MIQHRRIDAIDKIIHPAVTHQTLIGRGQSERVEVWYQRAKPGRPTPLHQHPGEEIIVVLEGRGWCEADGQRCAFGPGSVLNIPANTLHRVATEGDEDVLALAILEAPVHVLDADGKEIRLPWPYGDTPGSVEPTPARSSE